MVSGVVLSYDLGQMGAIYMHVHFGGGYAFMTQHLLNGPKIGTVLQQMCRERMPKCMWTDVFFKACFFCQLLDYGKYHGPGQLFAPSVQK